MIIKGFKTEVDKEDKRINIWTFVANEKEIDNLQYINCCCNGYLSYLQIFKAYGTIINSPHNTTWWFSRLIL